MRIIKPYIIVSDFDPQSIQQNIEKAGRVCYKSEDKITPDSSEKFINQIIKSGHESVLEHQIISVKFICDRGITHEIARHRIAAYSQESTRYCRYSQDKFGNEITVIEPYFFKNDPITYQYWSEACRVAEKNYMALLDAGCSAQEARSVLPTCLKTEMVVTYNIREWRHFFRLRADKAAHPQMQQLAIPLLLYFKEQMPALFGDIEYNRDFVGEYAELVIE